MSWMAKLYETYEQGVKLNLPDEDKLMPISHTLQNAHINIVIDNQGNFLDASVKEKTQIVLPATESSAGRSSGEASHPLADKLQYVAKDYAQYGGLKKAYFDSYKTQLSKWCDSPFSHPKAQAVYRYIEKGQVIADLIRSEIVYVDNSNVLLTKWPYEVTQENPLPKLFKVLPKEKGELDQGSALVCWTVQIPGDPCSDTWNDKSLQESWIAFDASSDAKAGLCYVIGNNEPLAINHPAKLRHTGDKAKLISSNDLSGFTYRGKLIDADQACGVSFNVTQKAHNALRWLISRQGSYRNGEQVIIAWAVSGKTTPPLMDASYAWINDLTDLEEIESSEEVEQNNKVDHSLDFGESFAIKLRKKMAGYRAELGDYENIIIMAIDSATPGRMGITYYQEYFSKEFIDRLESWHLDFSWPQRYTKSLPQTDGKKPKLTTWLISAPIHHAIGEAAYGKTITDSLKKNLFERLIPCIVEGSSFPIDIVNACVNRASNPSSGGERWEWERNLGVACALYRGFYRRHPIHSKRRNYAMTLEINNVSRDYLYGRLLAIAERIEKIALNIANENRVTTAERLMQRFADRPYSTWRNIELALKPYMQRLQNNRTGFLINRLKELDEVMNAFKPEEFKNDEKLSGEFLLAYHCQRQNAHSKNEPENLENV